ncbi:hypothetical protein Tco_0971118 [Tanacetum coccineum]
MDGRGDLCFPRGLGSLDRIEFQVRLIRAPTHRDHVYALIPISSMHDTATAAKGPSCSILRSSRGQSKTTKTQSLRIPDHQDASRDADSHIQQIMAPTTRRGQNTHVNNTNLNNMTSESIQAMIDQALLRNSTNGDGSHSSHEDNRRNVQTVRPCFYVDFMKYQPLNFKGTEGVVCLTRWIEKMK